jgi:thiol-disulfide isomerase/thioredoxin
MKVGGWARVFAGVVGVALLSACGGTTGATTAETPPADFRGAPFAPCPAPHGSAPSHGGLPAITLPCLREKGGEYALSRPTGAPSLVTLWASWCAPCGEELPVFGEVARGAAGRVGVLGVVTEDSAPRAIGAARDARATFPTVYDRGGRLLRALGKNALPVTIFVDPEGRVRHVYQGPALDRERLIALMRQYLGVSIEESPG